MCKYGLHKYWRPAKPYLVSHLTQWSSPVTCNVSRVTCHMSHVTCHLSPVTCHLSPVTCHMPHVNLKKRYIYIHIYGHNSGASRWSICYQGGLPCLVFIRSQPFPSLTSRFQPYLPFPASSSCFQLFAAILSHSWHLQPFTESPRHF